MSRMRQVPVMDITKREKAMSRNRSVWNTRSVPPAVCARLKKAPAAKLHLSDAPALLSNGCHSVKELCTHVQHITTNLNQLINSVEHLLPLLAAYMSASPARGSGSDTVPAAVPKEPELCRFTPEISEKPDTPESAPAGPSPDELQQLFENPLVKNLMSSFMQGNLK